jgi:hypothetical protein
MRRALASVQTRTAAQCWWSETSCIISIQPVFRRQSAHGVLWKTEQQLLDRVHIVLFELHPRPNDAFLKRQRFVGHKVLVDLLHLFGRLAAVLQRALDKVGLGEVGVDALDRLDEERVKLLPRPLRTRGTLGKSTW